MLEAYFDESGIHDGAKVCVIAGYFGYAPQWRSQEKRWRKVLADFNFPLEDFHATELIDSTRHQPMLAALANVIARSGIYPVSSGIFVDDFYSFTEKQRKFMTGATLMPNGKFKTSGKPKFPYFVPFQIAVRNVTDYTKPGRRSNFFFGLGKPMEKYALAFFQEIKTRGGWSEGGWTSRSRLGDTAFPLAKETPQLQAADLFALLSYRYARACYADNSWVRVQPDSLLKACLANTRSRYDHGYETRESASSKLAQARIKIPGWDEEQ